MEMRSSYQRVNPDGDGDNDNYPDAVISPLQQTPSIPVVISSSNTGVNSSVPDVKGTNPDNLTLKVLKGEQSKTITVPKQASVAQLKSLIEPAHDVPVAQQRLVFKGKPLRPNEDSLSSFHITNGSTLHLFPLPATATTASGDANLSASMLQLTNPRATHITGIPPHLMRPIHFVPEVVQSIREVKMWCYILIITSAMDIFTNLSFLGSQGHAGRGVLDSILNIIQTTFGFLGLYVGQLGLRCTTTTEANAIKQYVYSLTGLAVVNIVLKTLWVFDVVLLAKKGLREAHDEEDEETQQDDGRNDPGGGKGGGQYTDDTETDGEPMSDSSFMIYFSIQAVIMAGIAISMWIACVNRARSFQRVVQSYEGIANRA